MIHSVRACLLFAAFIISISVVFMGLFLTSWLFIGLGALVGGGCLHFGLINTIKAFTIQDED